MTVRLVFIVISIIVSLSWCNSSYADLSTHKLQKLKKRAERGIASAQLELGNRASVSNHYKRAYYWYNQLTKQSDPHYKSDGYNTLGLMYLNGQGPASKDFVQAKNYFKQAINLGQKQAYGNLAIVFDHGGYGIKQDKGKAKRYYKKSAKAGDASAKFNLGNLYAHQNQYNKAFHWYHQAAKQYYLRGMYVVGILYAIGKQGVRQNKVEGCKWFRLALKVYPDYQKAHYMLGKLMPTMDYTQKYACHQAVKKYLKHHDVPRKSDFKARLELKS